MFFLPMLLKMGVAPGLAKILGPLLLILLVFASYAGTYWWGTHVEKRVWQGKIEQYNQQLKTAKVQADLDVQNMQTGIGLIVADLGKRLKDSEDRKNRVLTITKEVTKYVTPKADGMCVLTAGFASLYNVSVGAGIPGVPAGGPEDADAPIRLKASEFGAIAAANNAECVDRGTVIESWQTWYGKTKALWDQTRAKMPALPELPH